MIETWRNQEERVGVELEFDELWNSVYASHLKFSEFISASRIPWASQETGIAMPEVVFSDEIGPGLDERSDDEIFGSYVNQKITMANIAKYVGFNSLAREIEINVAHVNAWLGYNPDDTLVQRRDFTGNNPKLYLHGVPGSKIHGYGPKRSVRLFGFNSQGTAAVVKRFGDTEPYLDTIAYSSFCYGTIPKFKPTLDQGDYDVIPEAEDMGGASFH